ncbi:MAG: phosphate acyltransferase PlsX [Clostridia bacterium]|nr:phosphate acyltransferase PlsX [Clostridia bacterium]
MSMIKIAVDAMGGDYAPEQQVKGAVQALQQQKDLFLYLCGDKTAVEAELAKYKYDASRVEVVHTTEIITNEEEPAKAVKMKKDSSTVVAFRLVKDGKADGVVSSGSTGAVLSCGVLILGRVRGISRPGLCPALPNAHGGITLLCDCGANLECKPINLVHFALMGTAYAKAAYGVENPTVGLLNNGTEDHKGDLVHQEANLALKTTPGVNYVGNVEGREIMLGDVNVVVSDGYTGNVAVKSIEGTGKAVGQIMKREFKRNIFTMLGAAIVSGIVGKIKKTMDYERCGGAMMLGLSKVVVKGHGNSKAKGFAVCISQAADAVRGNMVGKISDMLEEIRKAEEAKQAEAQAAQTETVGAENA